MRVQMNLYAQEGVLAGLSEGKVVFADLLRQTQNPSQPEVYFLDFTDVEVATTSFLRESIVAYRTHVRSAYPNVYPVAANLSVRAREDLDIILELRGDAYVICELKEGDKPFNVKVVGQLDGKQRIALDAVLVVGETDAPTLSGRMEENVGVTAWNNRLVALSDKGILIATNAGRSKLYRPVLEGMRYGS